MTLALNYTFKDLSVFLKSLNTTDFSGTVFLVVNDKIDIPLHDLHYKIEQYVVKGLKFDSDRYRLSLIELLNTYKRKKVTSDLLKDLRASGFTNLKLLHEFASLYHCQISRYAIYLAILLNNKFDKVFLTDSRDVYFQASPFANWNNGLHVFQENVNQSIKHRWYNRQWVQLSTSYWNYFKIRNEGIFCSGTILGDYDNIVSFLKIFLDSTLKNNLPMNIKGLDQGLFNVLIHTNKIDNYQTHADQKHVLTLAALSKAEFSYDDKCIYNAYGHPAAVVHQYNRRRDLKAFVEGLANKVEKNKAPLD